MKTLCFLHSYVCRLAERGDSLFFFFEPTEGKSERENSLMQYNKVANLSSASLSTGDLEHYVYRNSQCSVWEVAKRRCVLSTERLYMLQISHRIKTRQVK